MANRTTATAVKAIIQTQLETTDVDAFIDTANIVVTNTLSGTTLSSETLADIEKWLAAHLIASTVTRQTQRKKIGDAEDIYAKLGMHLDSTTYGQTAKLLDATGTLAKIHLKSAVIEAVVSFDDSELLN